MEMARLLVGDWLRVLDTEDVFPEYRGKVARVAYSSSSHVAVVFFEEPPVLSVDGRVEHGQVIGDRTVRINWGCLRKLRTMELLALHSLEHAKDSGPSAV